MRKPHDFDSELKTLADKARQLKERRVRQFGELVVATGADTLDADLLAGVLLDATTNKDTATREGWRTRGVTFFQGAGERSRCRARAERVGDAARERGVAAA